jgi:hypothetical protein
METKTMKRLWLIAYIMLAAAAPAMAADIEVDASRILTNLNGESLKDCDRLNDDGTKCVHSVDMTFGRFIAGALDVLDKDPQGRPIPLKPSDSSIRGHLARQLMDATVPTTPGHGKIKLDSRDIELIEQQIAKTTWPPSVVAQALDLLHPTPPPAKN